MVNSCTTKIYNDNLSIIIFGLLNQVGPMNIMEYNTEIYEIMK